MHLTDEDLLAEHREEQRQKREDERLRAERKHELWKQAFSHGGSALMGGIVGVMVGILLSIIAVKISDTDDETLESFQRDLTWCKSALVSEMEANALLKKASE